MGPSIRELLEAAGYAVKVQSAGWTRCAVSRGEERWVGHGFDTDDALDHALAQMFPSHMAREVLTRALASPRRALQLQMPPRQVGRGVAEAKPTPAAVAASAATTPRPPEAVTPRAPAGKVQASPAREAEALRELAALLHHIDQEEPAFAVLAPDRQRLLETLWISRARAHAEAADSDAVQERVDVIARRLTELARAYYPGNVRALQFAARPADAQAGTRPPRSWPEAAVAAEQALDALCEAAPAAGLDAKGWADVEPVDPAPEHADEVARAAAEEIDAVAPPGAPADLDERAVARLVSAARLLRWVRPWVSDGVRWGRAFGRLRALAGALGQRAEGLREIVDPRHRPEGPWVAHPTPSSASGARPRQEVGAVPSAPAALARWIIACFDVAETVDIVDALLARPADVLALGERDLPTRNRKVVRRFREVQRLLAKTVAA